jgi:hypothetical protein
MKRIEIGFIILFLVSAKLDIYFCVFFYTHGGNLGEKSGRFGANISLLNRPTTLVLYFFMKRLVIFYKNASITINLSILIDNKS